MTEKVKESFFTIPEEKAREFLKRLKTIRSEIVDNFSEKDYEHFKDFKKKKMLFKILAYTTAPFFPNPVTISSFAVNRIGNWLTMHFISHKAYDKVPGVPEYLKSKNFAKGKKRFTQWLDWILPEAWDYEHNILHHTYTGEALDPDIIEANMEHVLFGHYEKIPKIFRFSFFVGTIGTWRWSYYAPNTLLALYQKEGNKKYTSNGKMNTYKILADKKLWLECYAPYFFYHFIATPALYFPLGPIAMTNVFINSVMGEILANVYSFVIIGTNHTGEDVYRYPNKATSNVEKIFRQILGSVNFKTGGNWNDFFYMYLNYQIEHHIWPDLPMSSYQKIQPKVKALCEEFGVPYLQEDIWLRVKKTYDNFMKTTQMKVVEKIVMGKNDKLEEQCPDNVIDFSKIAESHVA